MFRNQTMRRAGATIVTIAMLVCSDLSEAATQTVDQVVDSAATPSLRDVHGNAIDWNELSSRKHTVIGFFGVGCPLAKLYATRYQEIAAKYASDEMTFLAVDAHPQDSLEEMAAFVRSHGIEITFAKDLQQNLAKKLAVARTPEFVVIDDRGTILYQGRIDDQYGVGYTKRKPEQHELADALDALKSGAAVSVARTEPVGCLINFGKPADENSQITYCNQVVRILNEHCVRCHRAGQIGPFAMDSYEEVAGWAEMIGEVIRENRMPPWHANPKFGTWANDCSLSESDKQVVFDWIDAGSPYGDEKQLPEPPTFVEGWQLPRDPDVVIPITEESYKVPATGDVRYKYFVIDPKFTEDKWVAAVELRPSNLRVVHHILCFVRARGDNDTGGDGEALDGFLAGYVPGMLPQPFPPGTAKRIPKDSELVFQVHYTPIGTPQEDQSQLALVFADETKLTHEVITTCAVNPKIEIPPGDDNHVVSAWNRRPLREWQIVSLMPHMHLRGKAFQYEAVYPDGRREILLDVPKYDFNWQTSYLCAQPLTIPEGTRVFCTAAYDNSENNLNNPNPRTTVRWGDQTWEEMMIGYFDVAIPLADEASREMYHGAASNLQRAERQANELLARWDKNADRLLQRNEVPERSQKIFDAIAADGRESITAEDLAAWIAKQSRDR